MYQPRHFNIYELTCKHVYDKFGDTAFQIFDEKLLRTLDLLQIGCFARRRTHQYSS